MTPEAPPSPPSRTDGVVAAASEVVGGPAGEHLATSTRRGLVGTGLLAAVPLLTVGGCANVALALLTRAHCRRTGWASPDQFVHACYSDVPTLVATGAASGQPPGTALLLRLLAVATSTGAPHARPAFDAAVLLAAIALVVATWCVARTSTRRWDAALVALSPVVVTAGLVSVDLVAVAALAGALLAWSRGRPLLAGVLIGVAASVRPAVAVVLLAFWLGVLVRDASVGDRDLDGSAPRDGRRDAVQDGRLDVADAEGSGGGSGSALDVGLDADPAASGPPEALPAALATAGAVAAGCVLTLLARIGSPGLPGGSTWLSLSGGAGYGSVWLLPSLAGRTLAPRAVLLLCGLALVVVLLAGTAAAARTAQTSPDGRPHLPTVALVLLAGVLALGPSVPVQATLVVLPLAALAAPRWRDHLPWGGAEVVYATVTWLYLYSLSSADQRGAPPWMYAAVVFVRLATLGWLALAAVQHADGWGDGADGSPGADSGDRQEGADVRTGRADPLRSPGLPCGRRDGDVVAAR